MFSLKMLKKAMDPLLDFFRNQMEIGWVVLIPINKQTQMKTSKLQVDIINPCTIALFHHL